MKKSNIIAHKKFMEVAEIIADMSKCQSIKVCALFVKDNRIISTGVNGSPSGHINCSERFPTGIITEQDKIDHYQWQQINEVHAEENAMIYAAKNNISLKDCVLYCTYKPCFKCTKMLVTLGIKEVYYRNYYIDSIYKNDPEALLSINNFIKESNVSFIQI